VTRRFEDKVVVITGASSGIGAAAAKLFSREGAKVALAARTAADLEAVAAEIRAERGTATAIPTDVADLEACAALLERTQAELGDVHVLVNNAGLNKRGPVQRCSASELAYIVDVNLRAPVALSRMALPYLHRSGGGAIVNVASLAGRIPLADEAVYSATKFGLRAFTIALAEELRGSGVTASVISPGPVDTNFIMQRLDDVPDIVFSQPMSTAGQIAHLIVDSAADGIVERTHPRMSGYLATLGYLVPALRRALYPFMERQGRRAKQRFRDRAERD
jgi:short-subunit dehydrogenase